MTASEICRRLTDLGAGVKAGATGPVLVLPEGVSLTAEEVAAAREHRQEVMVALHGGRVCAECKGTLFVDQPADVRLVCVRAMCPSYVERLWPEWAGRDRWFEQRRRDEAAQEQARMEEAIPD